MNMKIYLFETLFAMGYQEKKFNEYIIHLENILTGKITGFNFGDKSEG